MNRGSRSRGRRGRRSSPRPPQAPRSNDTTITGAGSTFVAPLVSAWTPALGSAFGYTVQYSGGRLGRRHRGDHEPPGRLRRLRRPADPGPGAGLQGLRADPVGAVGDHRSPTTSRARRCTSGSTARRSRTSSWATSQLERPRDRGAEPGREPAEPEDHAGLPLGRLGHVLQLHRLPVRGQRRRGSRRSASRRSRRSRPGSARKGSAGVAGVVKHTTGGDHLRRRRVRAQRTTSGSRRSRTRPGSSSSRASGGSPPRPPPSRRCRPNNEMHIVNPPKSAPLAYPISTYTYIIVPKKSVARGRAPEDRSSGR